MQKSDKLLSTFTVYFHGSNQKIGPLCDTYQAAVTLCRKIFPELVNITDIGFYGLDEGINDGYPAEICKDVWKDVTVAHIKSMVVVDQSSKPAVQKAFGRITIETMTGKSLSFGIQNRHTMADLKYLVQQMDGTPVHLQQIIFNGVELADRIDVSPYNGELLHLRWKRRL